MAIKATYKDGSIEVAGATVRLDRIWGSKKEQWNAWVHVLKNESDTDTVSVFSVTAPYVEGENPYVALYAAVSKLTFLSDITHDVEQPEAAPKAKKNKKQT